MTKYLKTSRVCLAGRFNADFDFNPEKLEASSWTRVKMSVKEYNKMSSHYYPSLLHSMVEVDGKEQSSSIDGEDVTKTNEIEVDGKEQSVCRYMMKLEKHDINNLMILKRNDGSTINFPCGIVNIQLWFFPFKMVLFSIEIEEHTESLSDLGLMHSYWKNWSDRYCDFRTKQLDDILSPLSKLTTSKSPSDITYKGTKMRQYQLIETDTLSDELLYELGSFSPIGVVSQTNPKTTFKPSDDYFAKIIRENSLSVFSNWKALALNDSFTVLTIDDFFEMYEFHENFELLYMRCLFEEFYCFDRNNLYREDEKINSVEIEKEISYIEKHYFFDEISYDFLPPLIYKVIAKGLELQKDREQLTQHVKKALTDARQERNSSAVNFVQIFAVFSVFWTIHQMVTTIWPCIEGTVSACFAFVVAIIITAVLLRWPSLLTRIFHN